MNIAALESDVLGATVNLQWNSCKSSEMDSE